MMAPPLVVAMGDLKSIFTGAIEKSEQFSSEYAAWAKRYALPFLDTSQIIVSSPRDGIHIDPPEHAKLGIAVAAKIRELIDL
jgi:lysophospholipase L1-like esterase